MNREEAIKIFSGIASLAKINTEPTMSVCNVKNEVFTEILQALLVPQPDPITGLMPCGCGGYIQSRFCDYGEKTGMVNKIGAPIKSHPYLVRCAKCGITVSVMPREAKARGYASAKTCAEDTWNTAHGWKSGAK